MPTRFVQPMGAGSEAVTPAAEGVELPDQLKEPGGGHLDVGGEHRDLVAQPLRFFEPRGLVHLDQHEFPFLLGKL